MVDLAIAAWERAIQGIWDKYRRHDDERETVMVDLKIGCRYLWRNHWVMVWAFRSDAVGVEIEYDGSFQWLPRNELDVASS